MTQQFNKRWTITIDKKEIFKTITDESLYAAYVRMADNPKFEDMAISDDDYAIYSRYYDGAIAQLTLLLARRFHFGGGHKKEGDADVYDLVMEESCDDNIAPVLAEQCQEFIIRFVLGKWLNADLGAEAQKKEINHCLHYRYRPTKLNFGPLF
jgi:hypothetical protein